MKMPLPLSTMACFEEIERQQAHEHDRGHVCAWDEQEQVQVACVETKNKCMRKLAARLKSRGQ